jgi:hypothetical protein
MDSIRRRRWIRWALLAAGLSVVLMVAAWQFVGEPNVYRVGVCDAWSVELKDGTVLYAPGYTQEAARNVYGPCWDLPAGVTTEDLR